MRGHTTTSQKAEPNVKMFNCPRCGERSYEQLRTYSHCPNCLYSEDRWEGPDATYFKAMKDIAEIEKAQVEKVKQRKEKNEISNCA